VILAFDTSTDWLTVAIGRTDTIVAEINEAAPRAHLTRLLPAIDSLMQDSAIDPADIGHIAVGVGPGSFTGLRIAISTARGLAHALERPLIGVSTLDVLAGGLIGEAAEHGIDRVYPVLDAKRREVYTAGYDAKGARLTDYQVLAPGILAEQLNATGTSVLMGGDGLVDYAPAFADRLGEAVTFADASLWPPRASVLIRLAKEKIDKGEIGSYFDVLPIYIRLPDAKEAPRREE